MHFIDDVNLVTRSARAHIGIGPKLPDFINPAIAGTINFQHVHIFAGSHARTNITLTAWFDGGTFGTI